MCDCGCNDKITYDHPFNFTAEMQPLKRHGRNSNGSMPGWNTVRDARKVLTYDDESDEYSNNLSCHGNLKATSTFNQTSSSAAASQQSIDRLIDITRRQAVATVQRPPSEMNGSLDYAGAVRNSNGRSRMPQRFRAALPPRGRTPCDPAYQGFASRSQNQGGYSTRRA